MKTLKRLSSMLLAVLMVMAMAIPAFATQEGTLTGGSITINDAVPGQTYNAYQILYLESYNKDAGAYAYKANSAWETWLRTQTSYVSFDSQGYVTWVENADAAKFAKLAQVEAAKMTADATATAPAAEEGETYSSVEFNNLKLGYYLVDTSLGALCSLDTTNPSVKMFEKNEVPTVEKQVKEDSTGNFGGSNTAQIGDTVEFKTTIHAKKGAQNYVLHDELSNGLTLNSSTIKVQVSGTDLDSTNYSVSSSDLKDSCDFEITFTNDYLATITTDTDIVVTYSATLNENAVISNESNTNKTWLDYGDSSTTSEASTNTDTFKFDIIKTDSSYKVLDGAKFELYNKESGGDKISLVKEVDGTYRVATTDEIGAEGFESAIIEAGKVTVKGLDSDTYWLEETKAPDGYNKLAGRVEVKIENGNLTTTMTGDTWAEGNGGVQITNKTGAELPSTGGMGTTIFYIAGTVLVLGAGLVLVTRRRMSR